MADDRSRRGVRRQLTQVIPRRHPRRIGAHSGSGTRVGVGVRARALWRLTRRPSDPDAVAVSSPLVDDEAVALDAEVLLVIVALDAIKKLKVRRHRVGVHALGALWRRRAVRQHGQITGEGHIVLRAESQFDRCPGGRVAALHGEVRRLARHAAHEETAIGREPGMPTRGGWSRGGGGNDDAHRHVNG